MGASLSTVQQQVLLENFERAILMLDGDASGRRATRQIALQLQHRIPLRIVEVPLGRQPDQLDTIEIRRLLETPEIPR